MESMAAVATSPLPCNRLLPSSASPFSHGLFLPASSSRSVAALPRMRARRTLRASAMGHPRRTLSDGWDPSGSVRGAFRMPRFEELDTTNMLLRQRIVFLGSQVDTMTADFIVSQLLFLDAEDQEKEIKLFINSPGGSVTDGMGIYDAMKLCKADISTVCFGLAASMGAFLLAAGTKGKRFCMPNSKVMVHQPQGMAGGNYTEMMLRVKELNYQRIKMIKILSRITGKPEERIDIDTKLDKFMNPWEAKEYGLVDAVIDDGKPGLVAPIAEAIPPPETRVWYLWKNESSKGDNLPSEENLSKIGYKVDSGSDEEKGKQQPKEEPTTV